MPHSKDFQSPAEGIKSSGLKVTAPRVQILELFREAAREGSERHLSAEDVYRIMLANHVEIGLATVYRVLMQFEQAGLLRKHHFDANQAVYELADNAHHDHLVCIDCGHVEEFVDEGIEERQHAIALERGYKLHDHSLSLYVNCTKTNCDARNKS